jgi:glycine C-acetyltransferase
MALTKLDQALSKELKELQDEGRTKIPERVITCYIPAIGKKGPRYTLRGEKQEFIRMNSNSYLSLSCHPEVIKAADKATAKCGVGPGAVRFIDGTYSYHVELEKRIAEFTGKPAAKIFNSAYTANCGLALTISSRNSHWIGDALNHNSIIRAMRISGVPRANKGIYLHNDMADLNRCLHEVGEQSDRVIVIFDGIFSMRGDFAPIDKIAEQVDSMKDRFAEGIITVIDDSHGIGAYGTTGRGTPEHTGTSPDIIVGTFGKAFGVNGGFIAGSELLIEAVRQKADTYIYTNPLSVADCAAASKSLDICDSEEGSGLLETLRERTAQFRTGLKELGFESIPGPHPVVPLLVRDTAKTHALVQRLFENGILAVGLTFPVVPKGSETIRFQVNCGHSRADIEYVLDILGSSTSQA